MSEIEKLEQGIAILEAQRLVLGDDVVDAMLLPIREKLALLRSQDHPVSQRKQITVLFADLSGFTKLSSNLDAEDVLDEINLLWKRMDLIVARYGGLVDKHIGDEIMALWGTDTAREDDPERAVRAALDMQSDLMDFCLLQNRDLNMRIGIHTGPTMLGLVGSRQEYTAMGDTVNLASRLQHAAPIGGMLISHNVYRQTRGVFDFSVEEPLLLKGKSEPVQAYRVHQLKPRAFRVRTRGVEGIETRMIGRESELNNLQAIFRSSLANSTLQLITISGDAGVGKSRLLYEFQNWLDLYPANVLIFKGRSTEVMQKIPYALLRDIFSYRFEIADSDSLIIAHQKLEQGILEYMPEDENARMKAHFIGHLIGLDYSSSEYLVGILDDPNQIRLRALMYLVQFFQSSGKAMATIGTVLLLDDLHWVDDPSLEALTFLENNLRDLPIMFICLARPVLFEQHPEWQGGSRIDIKPLDELQSSELIQEILQKTSSVPQDLIRILVAGAEGNPFYIEELVKMLIDQKVILPDKNEWFIELKRLKSIQVPSTLIGVLQARLDTLPADELETMQRASVVGRVFWDGALDALVDSGIESQHVRLGLLGKRELIYERGESIFAGTKEFVFKHALLREVTYESVLKRTKRTYHARTAAWFINMARERVNEYAGVIAEHFEQAQEYFVAAEWYSKAGEIAIGRSAFKTAADYFANALELTPPDMTNHTVLARQKGDAYFRMGDLPRAQQALMEAHDTSVSIQDHADALALLAEVSSEMGDYDRANTLLSEALPQARECANHLTLTRALFALGSVQWRMGNLFESKAAFTECLVLARELGDGLRELFALNRLGAVSLSQGDLEGAERMWLEVHARATEIGNRERAMAALNNLGSVASLRNEYIQANNYILGALDIARELGTQQTVALALINLGEVNINLGNLTQARQMLREGLGLALQLGMLPRILGAIIFFAELAHAEGDDNRCWTLWGLAKNHPAWTNELQRAMNSAIERWQVRDAEIEKILMLGAKLDWDQTIKELLSDN